MEINLFFSYLCKSYILLVLGSDLVRSFKLSANVSKTKLQKNITSKIPVQILDPQTTGAPTFAEIGAFFTPRPTLDSLGNGVYSFLHSSNSSVGVDHDIVKLSDKSAKFHISGVVNGLVKDKPLSIIIGTTYGSRFDILIEKVVSVDDNKFSFPLPKGQFYIKTEGSGYFLPGVKKVVLPCKSRTCKFVNEKFTDAITVKVAPDDGSVYTYNWKLQNTSQFGVESINRIPQDESSLLSPDSTVLSHTDASDASAKLKLLFGVELHGVWGSEYANRLLSVFLKFDFLKRNNEQGLKNQKWLLTDESLYPQDVEITKNEPDSKDTGKNHNVVEDSEYEQIVKISRDAFKYSTKQAVDKKKNGFYFSRRLYKSVIRAICLHNPRNMKKLFKEVHDVHILEPFELEYMIREKRSFTHYPSSHYQSWLKHPEELIEILTSWREYPSGLHKVKGLKYFLRRQDGMVNPEEPTAPAIAYPRGPTTDSYIEFMESGFHNYPDVSQLILHEIAHFVDFNTVPDELRQKWSEIGGWFKDPKDPDGWSTRKQTEFVSAYAHQKNPGEDFASSLADYVLNPKLLRSRSLEKFKFIKDNVMGGVYYRIKATHEFKVLNLGNADYFYPGRLAEIDVVVKGKVSEPKKVKMTFKLLQPKNKSGSSNSDTCARFIKFRLYSEIGTFEDILLRSKNGCSHVLEEEITINQLKKRGVWTTDQIVITDDKGLQRFVGSADFGLRVWINNGSEDFQDPRVLTNSVSLALVKKGEHQAVRVGWLLVDDAELRTTNAGYAAINGNSSNQHSLSAYSKTDNVESKPNNLWRKDVWSGSWKVPLELCSNNSSDIQNYLKDPSVKFNTHTLKGLDHFEGLTPQQVSSGTYNCYKVALNIPISKSSRSGDYFLTQIITYDLAGNSQLLQWPTKAGPFISFTSSDPNPDNTPPKVKDIKVTSKPTNPDSPNGETLVEISFDLCDSGSGISSLSAILRDPFGANLLLYPTWSDTKGCQRIVHTNVLPKGSIPGVWHLNKIYAQDFAGNEISVDLTERILVDPSK